MGRLRKSNHFGKPLFSDKNSKFNKTILMGKDLILGKNVGIAGTFNDFLTSLVSKLNILRYQDPFIDSDQTELGTQF